MVRELGINELFPFLPKKSIQVQVCVRAVLSKRRKRELSPNAHISQYIYIYYTLHTLFGPLDLMSQSSELG